MIVLLVVVFVVVLVVVLVTGENKVNSYSDQLKLGWVCKFGVEFNKRKHSDMLSFGREMKETN